MDANDQFGITYWRSKFIFLMSLSTWVFDDYSSEMLKEFRLDYNKLSI